MKNNINTNISVNGYYETYRNGKLLNASKNKLTPLFLDYFRYNKENIKFDDSEFINELYYIFNNDNHYSYYYPKLAVSNQINLEITESSDNFVYVELVDFNYTLNQINFELLNLEPLEIKNDTDYYIIKLRHTYNLPKKNLGNLTGYSLYVTDVTQNNSKNFAPISVSHIRDNDGYKGTISHTENDNTIIVYTLEYRINKPLDTSVSVILDNKYINPLNPWTFFNIFFKPNHKESVVKSGKTEYFTTRPVEYAINLESGKRYIIKNNLSSTIKTTSNIVSSNTINFSTEYNYNFYYISPFLNSIDPYESGNEEVLENKPYNINIIHGCLQSSNTTVETNKQYFVSCTFNFTLTINTFEQF